MIPLLSIVRLRKPDPEYGVTENDTGTIVDIQNNGEAYTIEFVDEEGNSNLEALMTDYREEQLEVIHVYETKDTF